MLENEDIVRRRLLARVLAGADDETARCIMSMGSEMTVFRLLVAVARLDSHLSMGLLVIKYGVTQLQAKKARNEANKKAEIIESSTK
jgi:hypothetical protein